MTVVGTLLFYRCRPGDDRAGEVRQTIALSTSDS